MRIYIPAPLRSYTCGEGTVDLSAPTVAELVRELDRAYPGIRFRMIDEQDMIRPHIKLFVNSQQVRRLNMPLTGHEEIQIICALSGG